MPDRAAAAAQRLRHEADRLAGALPPLLVEAERIANSVIHGSHGYRRAGAGEAFWQFRRYQSGDPAAAIDWRQSAKSQRVFVRERERESAQNIWLWSDRSPSMRFGNPEKAGRAALLALTLAILLDRAGEHIAVLGARAGRRSGRGALMEIADALVPGEPQAGAASVPRLGRVPRHARLVLFSDFLAPVDDIARVVESYRLRGVEGCLVQVLDGAEEDFRYSGRARFEGMEGEGAVTIGRAESIAGDYHARFAAWRDALMALSRRAGWPLIRHRTDRPPQRALLAILGVIGRQP